MHKKLTLKLYLNCIYKEIQDLTNQMYLRDKKCLTYNENNSYRVFNYGNFSKNKHNLRNSLDNKK